MSPETETLSTYPQQLVYPKFIVLLKPRLNCKKSLKNKIEMFLWRYCIPGTIPSPLLNSLIITPQSYEVQIIIIIVQMKKKLRPRAVWLFIKTTEHEYESTQYGG